MINVSWIPAHPIYRSVSMLRYWKLLKAATLPEDRFHCTSVLNTSTDGPSASAGRFQKLLTRRVTYPALVKLRAKGKIVHVLDHSWSDLLPYCRKSSLKVVTVHDLIPLRFPGELSTAQAGRYRRWVAHVREADAVVAVSAYTKQEIEDLLGIDGHKIHVVFNGVEVPDQVRPTLSKRDSGVFHIGSIGSTLKRKNLGILPAALSRLKGSIDQKVVLVRAGAPLPSALADELRRELGEDGLIELGRLPDDAIHDYYAGLDVVVVPSLYEGFGLPVIEAMAAKVPVVASRCTSLPEVGGDLAYFFDPHSYEELASVLTCIVKDGVPQRRIDGGFDRAKSLSWRRCLEGVHRAYEGLLEKRPDRG